MPLLRFELMAWARTLSIIHQRQSHQLLGKNNKLSVGVYGGIAKVLNTIIHKNARHDKEFDKSPTKRI